MEDGSPQSARIKTTCGSDGADQAPKNPQNLLRLVFHAAPERDGALFALIPQHRLGSPVILTRRALSTSGALGPMSPARRGLRRQIRRLRRKDGCCLAVVD